MAAFPLDMLTELYIDGVWTKVPTYERDAVELEYGRPERSTKTDPGSLAITVNNRDGRFSPRNPMSPYFGKIGRNTRIRLSLPGEEPYLQLESDPAGGVATPHTASLNTTAGLDVRWEGEADWYQRGGSIFLISKWTEGAGRGWLMRLINGVLSFSCAFANGTNWVNASLLLPTLPRRAALRVSLVIVPDGVDFTFYWAKSIAGPWTQFGDVVSIRGLGAVTLHPTTSPVTVALTTTDPTLPPPTTPVFQRVAKAEVRNGVDGPIVAAPDFTGQAAGTTGFTDSAGRVWTLSGAAVIRDRHDLFVGEVSEWPQHWTPDGGDAWVPLVASGILRRMGQGKKAIQSSLRRRIPSYAPMAYWPMEEGEHATKAYSTVPGIDPLSLSQVKWAADTSLPSSAPLPTVDSQSGNLSFMSGMVRNYSWASLDTWSVIWMYRMPQVPAARQTFMLIRSTGTVRDWYLQFGPTDSRILGLGREGETLIDRTILTGTDIFGEWIKARFTLQQEGSNVRYYMTWQDIDGDAGTATNTVPGVTGRPTGVFSPPGGYSANLQGLAMGHISVWDKADPGAYDNAMNGWAGENAWRRMQRLATEEGVALTTIAGGSTPELVGPQTTETLLTLLQEAADADGGLLIEDRRRLGLVFRQRASMYSQNPRLVLSYDQAPGLAAPLEPVDDDTAIRNDRTVQRKGGGQARAVLEDGPLSVQDPPDGIGRYDDSITLNLYSDDQTEPIAYWRLALGTVDGPRYPTVTVILHKAPHLIPQILALTEGDLIRITGLPAYVGFGDADLIVDSVHHEMRLMEWTVTLNCQPAEPWQAGVADDAVLGKVDTDGSQLAAAVDATAATLPVTVTAGPWWITGGTVLNTNPVLATDLTGWTAFGATLERVEASTPKPFPGAWCMRLTPNGVEQYPNAGSGQIPVTPGQQYTLSGWLRCATARSVALNLNWFDGAAGYLSTSANDKPVLAGAWTWFEMTVTAPAGAAAANVAPTVADYPPPTDVLWAHQVTLRPQTDGAKLADFPFDVRAGGEVMTVNSVTPTVADRFTRTVANGWGTAETGQAWTATGGTAADFQVGGGASQHTISTKNVYRITSLNTVALADVDLMVTVRLPSTPTGDGIYTYYLARANVAAGTFYFARLYFQTSSLVELTLRKRTPDETALATSPVLLPFVAGKSYRVRFQVVGSTLRAKAWALPDVEPADWQVTATDTSITAAGAVGVRTYASTSNTNTSPLVVFDDLAVGPQRFGVTRSVNGVVKPQTARTDVRLAHPMRLAL
ncbi:hypothetical protein [Streptomyces ardesiacus]|uniref:CBM-cenC domain-containing protein n=1 Tax=Streptomyces ardesiacus TaxID=285564 RepID=A0ABW8H7B3_9ACTN